MARQGLGMNGFRDCSQLDCLVFLEYYGADGGEDSAGVWQSGYE